LNRTLWLWGPVILWMALIFYLSGRSDISIPSGTDKSLHGFGYTMLALLIVRALAGGLPARITIGTMLAAVLIATTYAATDEFHQMFVPGRTADVRDWIADALGAAVGVGICWLWGILRPDPRHGL